MQHVLPPPPALQCSQPARDNNKERESASFSTDAHGHSPSSPGGYGLGLALSGSTRESSYLFELACCDKDHAYASNSSGRGCALLPTIFDGIMTCHLVEFGCNRFWWDCPGSPAPSPANATGACRDVFNNYTTFAVIGALGTPRWSIASKMIASL